MKKSRFTEEQIIAILREQEAGATAPDVCRKQGVSTVTFYTWKATCGGMDVSQARKQYYRRPGTQGASSVRLAALAL